MSDKKAQQLTFFIVLGIVIVIAVGLTSYFNFIPTDDAQSDQKRQISATDVIGSVEEYINTCLKRTAEPLIFKIAMLGGTLDPESYRLYNGEKFRYLCTGIPGDEDCVNTMLSRREMELELNSAIDEVLDECINLDSLKKQVVEIKNQTYEVRTRINRYDVTVELLFPLAIFKEGIRQEIDKFSTAVNLPIGDLYFIAHDILNQEIMDYRFDTAEFMTNNGATVLIEKHRPYPDKIFNIKYYDTDYERWLVMRFAMQGFDTAAIAGFETPEPTSMGTGACVLDYEDLCSVNVLEGRCNELAGIFQPANTCDEAEYLPASDCDGHVCKDCSMNKKHGESWCAFDGPTGDGTDFVGSRQYRQICIDGKILTEDCRDYREELCAEEKTSGFSNAICRPNRWQDCVQQPAQGSCENDNERDCTWSGWMKNQRPWKCHPTVPPGFKHWNPTQIFVCMGANEDRTCDDNQCPLSWDEGTGQYCMTMGDCGRGRNIADVISTTGFMNSDLAMNHNNKFSRYGNAYLAMQPSDSTGFKLLGPQGWVLDNADELQRVTESTYDNPWGDINNMAKNFNKWMKQVDYWQDHEDDLMWDYIWDGEIDIWVYGAAICGTWQAPFGGKCEVCSEDSFKPCTEYRCRSLGQDCIFEEIDGRGHCTNYNSDDDVAPEIEIDESNLPEGFTSRRSAYYDFVGYRISPSVQKHKNLRLEFDADEPVACTLNLVPHTYSEIIPNVFSIGGTNEFKETHNMILPALSKDDLETVVSLMNVTDFIDLAVNFVDKARGMATQYGYTSQLAPYIDEWDVLLRDSTLRSFLNGFAAMFERDEIIYFVNCVDKAGNWNDPIRFVRFKVDSVDRNPPEIVEFDPGCNSTFLPSVTTKKIKMFVDEPAECRWDTSDRSFNTMTNSFVCDTTATGNGLIEVVGVPRKGFECETEVDFTDISRLDMYVRCRDNPTTYDLYTIDFEQTGNLEVLSAAYRSDVENALQPPNRVELDRVWHLSGNTKFGVETDTIDISFNLGYVGECKWSKTTTDYFNMENDLSCSKNATDTHCQEVFDTSWNQAQYYLACLTDDDSTARHNTNRGSYYCKYEHILP